MQRDIPRGMIFGWQGSIASIPNTFRLCNGTRGTPDLRDRFIVGAGGALAPADVGGSFVHIHVNTPSAHRHDMIAGASLLGGPQMEAFANFALPSITTDLPSAPVPYWALAFVMYDGRPL